MDDRHSPAELARRQQQRSLEDACVSCGTATAEHRCGHCGAARLAGGYRVLALVGTTPHSQVYKARGSNGRIVALKELAFTRAPPTEQVQAFHREAAMLRQLDHPGIPRFVHAFEEGAGMHKRLYLAQEFIEGGSLLEELEHHRFTEAEVLDIARQTLEVLVYLQSLSPAVLHRDLKPANLLRRPDGSIALVDFGTARDGALGTYGGTMAVGTVAYMAPEQLAGEATTSSDLYALGATLYHLLVRTPPRPAFEPGTHNTADDLQVSPEARAYITRLMSVEPTRRFPNAAAALSTLDAGLEVPQASSAQSRPRKRPSVIFAVAGLTLLLMMASLMTLYMLAPAPLEAPGPSTDVLAELPEAPATPEVSKLSPKERLEALEVRSGEEARDEMSLFMWQSKVDAKSATADENLDALTEAQERYKDANGEYLLFEAAGPQTWEALGVTFPGEVHHEFSASMKDGQLFLVAKGNLDDDAFLDVWWGGPANGTSAQLTSDVLNVDMYPDSTATTGGAQ